MVQKSKHVFSLIALDQNHEQENESVKGVRGAIGLTENPVAPAKVDDFRYGGFSYSEGI